MDFYALFTAPSFWFDVICGIMLIVFCSRYVKIGLLSAIIQIFGTLISLVGAHAFATFADTPVYEFLFEKTVANQVENLVNDSEANGIEALSETVLSVLPDSMQSLFEDVYGSSTLLETAGSTDQIVQVIMESTVSLIITQIIFMVLFFIGFVVCRMVVCLLVNLLRAANYIPVLGSVNRVLGWMLGAVGGVLDFYLAFCVLWVVILLTGDMVPVINTTDLAGSWFFELFQKYNPFS